MKIALCLSGGPRFKYRGLFRLMEALKGYTHADFFIRTWKTDEFGQTPEEYINYLKSNGLDDRCHFPVVQMLDDDATNLPPERGPLNVAPWAPNFLVMWWGIVKSYELFVQHQQQTGAEYDLVFRMRTDMVPEGDIDLTQYTDTNKIYNAKNFGDNFLFGSQKMYPEFVNYWNYLDHLSTTQEFIHPEESLRKFFEDTGVPYECISTAVQPAWDPGEYKGRPR
jgi:hypothetical protein